MNLAHDEKDAKGEWEYEQSRAEFIAWMRSEDFGDDDLKWFDYVNPPHYDGGCRVRCWAPESTQEKWDAWQAARADTARIVAEAVAKEREACACIAKRYEHQRFYVLSVEQRIRARSAQPDGETK